MRTTVDAGRNSISLRVRRTVTTGTRSVLGRAARQMATAGGHRIIVLVQIALTSEEKKWKKVTFAAKSLKFHERVFQR
jgi:hypothetical protein